MFLRTCWSALQKALQEHGESKELEYVVKVDVANFFGALNLHELINVLSDSGYGEEDVTKTAAGMRTIPISQPIILMLKEWKLRTKRKKDDDLVFPSKRGWYVSYDNMVKRKFAPLFAEIAKRNKANPAEYTQSRSS
jgi:hypothetical protein